MFILEFNQSYFFTINFRRCMISCEIRQSFRVADVAKVAMLVNTMTCARATVRSGGGVRARMFSLTRPYLCLFACRHVPLNTDIPHCVEEIIFYLISVFVIFFPMLTNIQCVCYNYKDQLVVQMLIQIKFWSYKMYMT